MPAAPPGPPNGAAPPSLERWPPRPGTSVGGPAPACPDPPLPEFPVLRWGNPAEHAIAIVNDAPTNNAQARPDRSANINQSPSLWLLEPTPLFRARCL